MAERIQRSRAKGLRMPAGAIYVGRPSKWGNPYVIGELAFPPSSGAPNGPASPIEFPPVMVRDAAQATALFRAWLTGGLGPDSPSEADIRAALIELRGKDLACWCALDQPCHADVLLELANKPDV